MMIFPITGNVRYPLTIDPTVWIFDERKIEVDHIGKEVGDNAQEAYYAKMGAAWDKGITEGSRTDHNKPMTREEKDAALRGSFAMPLAAVHSKCRADRRRRRITVRRNGNG